MKLNKTILFGFLFIALGGFVFISDILNPIIRPITYTFLMGSSKGKDIPCSRASSLNSGFLFTIFVSITTYIIVLIRTIYEVKI